ncbi:Flavin-dependent oxidoreductase, luciferase family (includes alkanesulfonate monooxygenase SsuD and methylene tetrahydromethanopterin reductase) [Quadrisphaera granulorum]|uniref:Alkanesulfonate monooxygenase SsuD/methylene tetrahydromethanopterin reductase-like flavin-dependent oxidoreductase (Luciferase family) n=1 Tax=Quadrisphaera granulorum TaxID=317664 RepID=A0A316A995_9ACTN|nr:LLM class flavin-dependent oxidoreductase [Quadrisphaera granulorum]PWJ54325.1 alkanesulfonate monooxygenase SsuD/methylene tetrahydromethanopterin reductase-like flavin-dependent oxidoreductase (luciferase family) [Quadrisphaera granulorum]SZE96097.1 Flavin-dependent oxidoreductase, luciferase family (includes alkanesulfonate monooxygenase SsuD and methylene tetrahydromethanopterin reductase) [Quadrisphaera granulorum]
MRFSLFVHMERWDESVSHEQAFADLTELVLMAEAGGFGTVWIGEHHAMEFTVSPSPMPQLAYLAAKTSTIRLGAGTIIAPFWNPIRVAGECALLDVISGGRMEVGLARGAYQYEFDRMTPGLAASDGGKHLRELVPAVKALWAGDYAHDGELWQFPTSTSVPSPVQTPGPPVWIAARDPASHDFAVAHGCNVMVTPLMKGDEEVVALRDKFEAALAAHPDVPRPDLMVLRHTHVHSESDPDGWRPAAEAVARYYRTFDAWFGNQEAPVKGFLPPSPGEKFAERPEFELDSLHRTAMIGTPAEVVRRIKEYEQLGVDEYSFWIDNGMTHEEKRASLQLFIEEVVPAFGG